MSTNTEMTVTETNKHTTDANAAQSRPQYPPVKPRIDIYEGAEGLMLMADLPGVSRDSLQLQLLGDELTIEGLRGSPGEEHGILTEFRPATFKRSIQLREKIDPDNVTAQLHDGVLQVILPKAPELQPRQIAIQTH